MTTFAERRNLPSPGMPSAPSRSPARADPRWALGVIAASAAAAVALWWQGTPAIHGFGDWLTNAGRITGLWAGYGMVVLVALW